MQDLPAPERTETAAPPTQSGLPAVMPPPAPRRRVSWRWLLLLLLAGGAVGGGWWWLNRPAPLPPWIAWSNGRIEADEVDISTKFAGRIAEILADEGTMVTPGQVVARMDTRDLAASLAQAVSQITGAAQTADSARADLEQQGAQVKLAASELQRARTLVPRGFETQEVLDQREAAFNAAVSAYHSIESRLNSAIAAREAAEHNAELIRVNIADNTLVAPKHGPIEYRLANVGEVLAAGGKVFTMLDVDYVYMDIFLPTADAGRVTIGADARILLDALPGRPIPARVSFVASQNQFTPKTVETKEERDKLMFRIRVQLDPALLEAHAADVRSGLPGLAYILLDPAKAWPNDLQTRASP